MNVNDLVDGLLQPVEGDEGKRLYDYYNEQAEIVPISEIVYNTESGKIRMKMLSRVLRTWKGLTLDVGCNNGVYKQFIENYVGLDIAVGFLKEFKGDRVQGSAEKLPFNPRVFDHVLMSETLEHLLHPLDALKEINRVLKKNGDLLITVPYGHDPKRIVSFGLDSYGCKGEVIHGCFNEAFVKMLFRKAGFRLQGLSVHPEAGGVTPCLIAQAKKK